MGIAAPDHAELVLLHPAPHRRVLLRHAATIGSAPGCTIRLRDEGIAGEHGEVRWDGVRWALRPLVANAGLAVNGQPVTWTALADRDVLKVGEYLFGFRLRNGAAAPVPAERGDLAAAAEALAEERRLWENELRRQRAEHAEREAEHRRRIASSAALVLRERDRVAAADRAARKRAAELDRLAGRLLESRRELDLDRLDLRYDAGRLDGLFAELGQERKARFHELARLEGMIDAARARLAAARLEAVRAARFGPAGNVARVSGPGTLAFAADFQEDPTDDFELAFADDDFEVELADDSEADTEDYAPATLAFPRAAAPDAAVAPVVSEARSRQAAEALELADGFRAEKRAALAELDRLRRDLEARRTGFAAERDDFDRAAAAERARLRAERDALDRRRQWLDHAAERWANLRSAGDADTIRREWARLRADLLAERVELLCERDRLASVEDELPALRRLVAKQRRLLARAHQEARDASAAWQAERQELRREAEELQAAVENLVAALLDTPSAAAPAVAPVAYPVLRRAA